MDTKQVPMKVGKLELLAETGSSRDEALSKLMAIMPSALREAYHTFETDVREMDGVFYATALYLLKEGTSVVTTTGVGAYLTPMERRAQSKRN